MNEKIIKPGIVKRTVDKLEGTKITIGGNKMFYQKEYNLKYTQAIVNNVLSAFMDVIAEALENGDSIKLNGYMTIEPRYYAKRKARNISTNTECTIPPQYRERLLSGSKLEDACKKLTEKELLEK